MAARAQFEQIRKGLPQGMLPDQPGMPGQPSADDQGARPGDSGGMYL
jgi:hypothetical protein